jgi:hypothetical protein
MGIVKNRSLGDIGLVAPTPHGTGSPISLNLDKNVSGTYTARFFPEACAAGMPLMPDIVADLPDPTCCHLNPESGIQLSQPLAIDLSSPRAREGRGRFVKGTSDNPHGRPRGIRNPRRRVSDLSAHPPANRRCRSCSTAAASVTAFPSALLPRFLPMPPGPTRYWSAAVRQRYARRWQLGAPQPVHRLNCGGGQKQGTI